MIRQNLHTHTIYDDGKNTPAEMAEAALAAGFHSLGFSGHSILPFENDWSMTEQSWQAYMKDVNAVKEIYAGRLTIFCGLEWDLLSSQETSGLDYIIGAIHHISLPITPPPSIDESPDTTRKHLKDYFKGDSDTMAEAYYSQYKALSLRNDVDIIAHFDLLTKFDDKYAFFEQSSSRYKDAVMAAMEDLLKADKIFEVNTGAMSRGWRSSPYPSLWVLKELKARSARILVSADAHNSSAISYAFSETEAMLREIGFHERWEYTSDGFAGTTL